MLHWLSAAVIIWATLTGFGANWLAPDGELHEWITGFNPQLTVLFIPFFVWRVGLYLHDRPWVRRQHAGLQEYIARLVHGALYAIIFGVLLSGVLMMKTPICVLGMWSLWQPFSSPTVLAEFHRWHQGLSKVLGALVVLHLVAVLKHQLSGNPILRRMIPAKR